MFIYIYIYIYTPLNCNRHIGQQGVKVRKHWVLASGLCRAGCFWPLFNWFRKENVPKQATPLLHSTDPPPPTPPYWQLRGGFLRATQNWWRKWPGTNFPKKLNFERFCLPKAFQKESFWSPFCAFFAHSHQMCQMHSRAGGSLVFSLSGRQNYHNFDTF